MWHKCRTLPGARVESRALSPESIAVYRCDQGSENGVTRLASVRCPGGLAFDIDRQTCDWKTHVKNCDKLESKFLSSEEVVMRRAELPSRKRSNVRTGQTAYSLPDIHFLLIH